MKLACPSCHRPLHVNAIGPELSTEVDCGGCNATVGVTVAMSLLEISGQASPQMHRSVVLAIANRELRGAYAARLKEAGWSVRECSEGRETLQAMAQDVPDVAVIDGGFAPIFGMRLGEIIKKSSVTRAARVLGLRADGDSLLPLPGADRTIPLTAGADAVLDEITRLSPDGGEPTAHSAPSAQTTPAQTTAAISKPTVPKATPPTAGADEDPAHAAARRLARIIVSDITLYNQASLEEAARRGNLREAIRPFLAEGREHYERRVDPSLLSTTRYFDEAVERYVRGKENQRRTAVA